MRIKQIKIRHDCDTGYYICNGCAKVIPEREANRFEHEFSYGSRRDMDSLNMVLCVDCLDNLTDRIIEFCSINPMQEWSKYYKAS